jgi:branched-chain amino acid transport system ATP-binding protein
MLELNKINTFYDKSHILHDISMEIREGEVVGILGRNGVGKSTTLKSIIGIAPPKSGSIRFRNKEMVGLSPHEIARLGIGYVPENRRIFPTLTVRENLLMGMKRGKKPTQDKGWTIERIYDLFPALKERDSLKGGYLSGGEQQMLTIGRTLMGDPQLILLDEPTEGLAPQVVEAVANVIREIHQSGVLVLLVEQSMEVVTDLADTIFIMSKGEIVFTGTPDELKAKPEVSERYLEV